MHPYERMGDARAMVNVFSVKEIDALRDTISKIGVIMEDVAEPKVTIVLAVLQEEDTTVYSPPVENRTV